MVERFLHLLLLSGGLLAVMPQQPPPFKADGQD